MSKRVLILPLIFTLAAAGAADAQYGGGLGGGGGMGGGMGGGGIGGAHHGGRQQHEDPTPEPAPDPDANKPLPPTTPLAKVQIIGVITGIDAPSGRVTITYDEVDALNWPRGTTPFQVERPELLTGLSVGEKVRFHVESQQISSISPLPAPQSQ
jgi:hypothetical protein